MPIKIRIDKKEHEVWVKEKDFMIEIPALKRPEMVIFNSGSLVISELTFNKPISEWILQLERSPHVLDRISAINVLKDKKGRRVVELALLKAAESDTFWGVRREAIYALASHKSKKYAKELMSISQGQDNRVRRAIWFSLRNYKKNSEVSNFLQEVIDTDKKYYSVSDAFKALVIVDSSAAKSKVEGLLERDSHTDVIRKSAISYFGSVKNDKNYNRLKKLVSYGGTTWDARPEAVNQLGKYAEEKIETLDLFVELLSDNMRSVRRNAVRQIGRYGGKNHLDALDELLAEDPILERDIRFAKRVF